MEFNLNLLFVFYRKLEKFSYKPPENYQKRGRQVSVKVTNRLREGTSRLRT